MLHEITEYFAIISLCIVGIMVTISQYFYSKNSRKRHEAWAEEDRIEQFERVKTIRDICDAHMDTVPKRLRTPDRQILISYRDLLRIWDTSQNIKDNL